MDAWRAAAAIRREIIEVAHETQTPHVGCALSSVEILAALYFGELRLEPWEQRDRFILSKGHSCLVLYAALAHRGLIDRSLLDGYWRDGGTLHGHPVAGAAPGIEVSTGSLGHGLPIGAGMAHGFKLQGLDRRVYVLMGDGECEEGAVWEAAMFSSRLGIDNLVAIVDRNEFQYFGSVDDICSLEPFLDKWAAFGWHAQEVDGHDITALGQALRGLPAGKPSVIVARTLKGKGIADFEGSALSHGLEVTDERRDQALADLTITA